MRPWGVDLSTYVATCRRCAKRQSIDLRLAADAAERLVSELEAARHPRAGAVPRPGPDRPWVDSATVFDPRDDARPLFESRGGKMFGVLVSEDAQGQPSVDFAFSSMYRGRWVLPGWTPPAFDADAWYALERRHDPEIKAADRAGDHGARARRSAALMARYHALHRFTNACGGEATLADLFGDARVPSGAGDCCGPKLVNAAHRRGHRVHSLCEVFVGASGAGGRRTHGQRYAPCEDKCGPLMGFLLCDCVTA